MIEMMWALLILIFILALGGFVIIKSFTKQFAQMIMLLQRIEAYWNDADRDRKKDKQ
jgi:hypothetical protein